LKIKHISKGEQCVFVSSGISARAIFSQPNKTLSNTKSPEAQLSPSLHSLFQHKDIIQTRFYYSTRGCSLLLRAFPAKWHGKVVGNFEKQIKFHSAEKKRQLILIINGVCSRRKLRLLGGKLRCRRLLFFFTSRSRHSSELLYEEKRRRDRYG
jgi:hypothetical protein